MIYPAEELRDSFLPNDVVNLLIGVPILLGSIWLARRGRLVGLLCWPGALLFVLYNYIAYLFGVPFGAITLVYLALTLVSATSMFDLLRNIDRETVHEQLLGVVPARTSGWVLVVFGIAFTFRAVGILAGASTHQAMLPGSEIGVLIADMVLSILWVVGGALLIRRMPLGYASGLGLLFAGSALFIALILFMSFQPVSTDAPFDLAGVVVVFLMGSVCFVPTGLFMRGVLKLNR